MKFSRIFFSCLVIFLALGAVSASQDIDNNLTVIGDETAVGDVNESVDNEFPDDVMVENTSEKKITADDFRVYTREDFNPDGFQEWDYSFILISDFPKDGTLKIYVDKKLKYSKNIVAKKNQTVDLDMDDLQSKLGIKTYGEYSISIKYVMEDKKITLSNYRFYWGIDLIEIYKVAGLDNSNSLVKVVPDERNFAGTVKVMINGKKAYSKKFKSSDKINFLYIKLSDLSKKYKSGEYSVKVTLLFKDGRKYSSSRTVKFVNTVPMVSSPYKMSLGENQSIILKAAKGSNGTLSLYQNLVSYPEDEDESDYYSKKGAKLLDVDVVNGYAEIPLNNLTEGLYYFIVEFDILGYMDWCPVLIQVQNNSKGFSANVTPSKIIFGEDIKVEVFSPKVNDYAMLYVDDVVYYSDSVELESGYGTKNLSGLKVGKHMIRVVYEEYKNNFFSETFYVVVKKSNIKLTIDKVNVKKSARKLKLTATLKIKGKPAKNKEVTFKFNKKTFIVKTNVKGVAKLTIKKKFFKNLKVGKKVSYQVSYGKITVKKNVKVIK